MVDIENKKLGPHHGILAIVIVVFLGLILIILSFKAGMYVGGSKSHFSSYKTGSYYKTGGHECGKKFGNMMYYKKANAEEYQAKAESMGMTMEEFKVYLVEQAKLKADDKEVEAESDTIPDA